MKAIGYLRVSTGAQADEGLSLNIQADKIAAWVKLNDAELLTVQSDPGRSGGRADNRPGLKRAVELAIKHKAALVVYSLSRLARSTRDAIDIADELGRAGADLVSITERIDTTSAAGKMVFTVIAALAEFERSLISERAIEVSTWLKSQGRTRGGTPYGYTVRTDGRLVANRDEVSVIVKMRRLRRYGSTLQEIADTLNLAGTPTKRGGRWHAKTVQRILAQGVAA